MSRLDRQISAALRCPDCKLKRALCICALLPRVVTRTRLVLLLHQLEAHRTSNTGQLAVRCLPNSEIVWRGREGPRDGDAPDGGRDTEPPPWLHAAVRPVLLFPAPEARPLIELARAGDAPLTLVVPDGTWSQASRARKRVPGLATLPCARLPDTLVSTYRLRHDPRPGHLSTMQAIAHALGILEGDAVADALLRVHQIAIERALYMRGRLPAALVTGGIPSATHARPGDPSDGGD